MSTAQLVAELGEDVRGITAEEYHALADQGLLDDLKVELLRGLIVEMASMGPPHTLAVEFLVRLLVRGLDDRWRVRPGSPVSVSSNSEPEPDLAVVPADHRFDETTRHPRRGPWVIEVAESSLRRDLGVKAEIYAEADVETYWVVDIAARQVVVHTLPVDGRYIDVQRHSAPATLQTLGLDVDVAELFDYTFPFG